jgi:hypothetical protein
MMLLFVFKIFKLIIINIIITQSVKYDNKVAAEF